MSRHLSNLSLVEGRNGFDDLISIALDGVDSHLRQDVVLSFYASGGFDDVRGDGSLHEESATLLLSGLAQGFVEGLSERFALLFSVTQPL